jgi:PKD repeat protein
METKTGFITVTTQPVGPAAGFAADRTSGASPLAVQFTDQSTPGSSPITSWQWNFGDGGTSAAQNPSHTYSSPGAYAVMLTVNTAVGTDTETKTGCVEVTNAGGNGTSGGCFSGSLTKSLMDDPVGRSRGDILLMSAVGAMLFSFRRHRLTGSRARQ